MNESTTPRTDAFLSERWKEDREGPLYGFCADLAEWSRNLERELSLLKSKRAAAVRYGADSLESDSIENSCNCLERTPEAHFHKPGCKYRLISERDDARQECELARQQHEYYRAKVVEFTGANEGMAKEITKLRQTLADETRNANHMLSEATKAAQECEQLRSVLALWDDAYQNAYPPVARVGDPYGKFDAAAEETKKALTNK